LHKQDEGRVLVDGAALAPGSIDSAFGAGIRIVHQELAQCPNLTVAENLCLHELPKRGPFVDFGSMAERAAALVHTLEPAIDVEAPLGTLSPGHRQMCQIAAALDMSAAKGSAPRVIVFADEIYSRIIYEDPHASVRVHPDLAGRTVMLDGFSKTYAMTGWRLGYGVMPAELAQRVAQLQTNCTSCTASFVQRAGIAALTGPQDGVEAMVAELRRRRDRIVELLNDIPGVSCLSPGGAFYVFPNVSGTGLEGRALAKRLLEEAGVACLAGTAFGDTAKDFLRFSYANSIENIEKGMERVKELVGSL